MTNEEGHKFLWITDPWETLNHSLDTTLRLIQESVWLGYQNYWCDVRSICLFANSTFLRAQAVEYVCPNRSAKSFQLGDGTQTRPQDFTSIQYRPDPPVDKAYLYPLQLLLFDLRREKSQNQHTEIVNSPDVLLSSSEKLEASFIPDLMPRSLVTSNWQNILAFGKAENRTVLKPLHNAQSRDVHLIDWQRKKDVDNAHHLVEILTDDFKHPVMLQQYLDVIGQGEMRMWFLDGDLLASAKKISGSDDFCINMDKGGSLTKADLSEREQRAANLIGLHLRRRRIRLAAVDLIDCLITDFNFTSPGLLCEFEKLTNRNLAQVIVKRLAQQLT